MFEKVREGQRRLEKVREGRGRSEKVEEDRRRSEKVAQVGKGLVLLSAGRLHPLVRVAGEVLEAVLSAESRAKRAVRGARTPGRGPRPRSAPHQRDPPLPDPPPTR